MILKLERSRLRGSIVHSRKTLVDRWPVVVGVLLESKTRPSLSLV